MATNKKEWTLYGLRSNFCLKAEEVAEVVGLERQGVLRYERNADTMNSYMREKFANFYGVPEDQIVFGAKDALRAEILGRKE